MNKTYIILAAIVAMLVVTGCTSTGNTGNKKTFIGGTEGIRASFLPGNPPDAVFDAGNSGFAIVLKLENIGENTVLANDGYVQINGLDPQTYGTSSFKQNFPSDVNGATMNFDGTILNGGVVTVDFSNLKYTPTIQGNLQQTVWADVCYKYTTKMTTQLCLKSNAQQLIADKKICDVEGEKYPQNSGGPVQVTSLKENFGGTGKIGVTMVISHQGNGDNIFRDTDAACDDYLGNPDTGMVYVKFNPISIGGAQVTPVCSGFTGGAGTASQGYVKLFTDNSGKGQMSLYCTLDINTISNTIEVPIAAELTYKYLQHIETPITIRHTGSN